MKRRLEALNAAQHKAAEAMYRTASASSGGTPGGDPVVRPARPAGRAGMLATSSTPRWWKKLFTAAQGSGLRAQARSSRMLGLGFA